MFGLTKTARTDRKVNRAFDVGAGASATPVETGTATGLVAGTKVATTVGWRAVEMVRPGDKVLTFDAGLQEVTHVSRSRLWGRGPCPQDLWPLFVPEGALGNQQSMLLLPAQPVMIESDVAEEIYGDPFVLVPAASLDGYRGIAKLEPEDELEVVVLHFEHDQVIFSSAGALFFCPSVETAASNDMLHGLRGDYTVLDLADADFLVGCMEVDEQQAAPQRSPDDVRAA